MLPVIAVIVALAVLIVATLAAVYLAQKADEKKALSDNLVAELEVIKSQMFGSPNVHVVVSGWIWNFNAVEVAAEVQIRVYDGNRWQVWEIETDVIDSDGGMTRFYWSVSVGPAVYDDVLVEWSVTAVT